MGWRRGIDSIGGSTIGGNTSNNGTGIDPQVQNLIDQQKAALAKQDAFMKNLNGKMISGNDGLVRSAGGLNRYGEARPDYIQMRGANGGLNDQFKQSMGSAGQAILDKGLAKGDSPWATAQRQMIEQQRLQGMGNAAQQNAAQQAQARSMMGMRGGVGSGASERMSQAGARNLMNANQGFGRQAAMGNLGVSAQDEQMKNQMLGVAAPMQQQIQLGNINRLGTDVQNQNIFNQRNYKEDMAAFGADKQAQAQAQANSGGK